jgi:hypothetical protein
MSEPSRDETSEASLARAASALERMAAALERMATALERALDTPAPPPAAAPDARAQALRAIRRAIRGAAWDEAEALVLAFVETHPDDPEAARLGDELAGARQHAARSLLDRIVAARAANDAERVLELRDAAAPLLPRDEAAELDRDLARWFMAIIQKRLRGGAMHPDLAILAARVAESLDATPEGASLRAALPTLRRSAGLCARCGAPYTGLADTCPKCLTAATLPPPGAAPIGDSPNGHPIEDGPDEDADVPDVPEDDLDAFRDEMDAP